MRLAKALHERASTCADTVEASLAEYVARCSKHEAKGTFAGVALDAALLSATRGASTVITIPDGLGRPADIRRALALAVAWCEARKPPEFTPPPGLKYRVRRGGAW